jgi:hypothetical protein
MSRLHCVLVVTGMHRSGTSLLASLAVQGGIDMGTWLLPAGKGNWRGHFEDVDFIRFHDGCLERRDAGPLRPPDGGVPRLEEEELRQARALVAWRAAKPIWGWKDPRTTLFLPAWAALLPNPLYLLVYRHPVEVALSLLRRGLDLEVQLDVRTAIRAWTLYNRQLLAFRGSCPERCLLLSIAGASRNLAAVLELTTRRFGLALDGRGPERLYAPAELHSGLVGRGIDWRVLLPEEMALHDRLEEAADLPGGDLDARLETDTAATPRERELEEASEHLLAAALRVAPAPGTRGVETSHQQRVDGSDSKLEIARLAERLEQRRELLASLQRKLEVMGRERARVERTRGWRLVHSYWGAARRFRGWRRQTAWRLRHLLGTLPPIRPDEVVVGCVAENTHLHLAQARRLVRSLRWFGGSLAGARMLVCVIGGIGAEDREALERDGAEVRIVAPFDRRNRSSNKLQFFAEAFRTGADGLLLLDCDTAIVGDLLPLLAPGALQAKIADVPSVTHHAFTRLFHFFGLPLPARRYHTTLQSERTIPYFNTGVVFLSGELAREFVPTWREWNARVLDHLDLLGDCAHHCHQASLSLALAAHPIPFTAAPAALNFPLHMSPQPPAAALLAAEPVILHYHDEVDASGCLLPCLYPRAQARIEALNRRLSAERPEGGRLPR